LTVLEFASLASKLFFEKKKIWFAELSAA